MRLSSEDTKNMLTFACTCDMVPCWENSGWSEVWAGLQCVLFCCTPSLVGGTAIRGIATLATAENTSKQRWIAVPSRMLLGAEETATGMTQQGTFLTTKTVVRKTRKTTARQAPLA